MRDRGAAKTTPHGCTTRKQICFIFNFPSYNYLSLLLTPHLKLPRWRVVHTHTNDYTIKVALRASSLHPLLNGTCTLLSNFLPMSMPAPDTAVQNFAATSAGLRGISSESFMMRLNKQRRLFCVLLSSGQPGSCDCSKRRSCIEHMSSEDCFWKLA